MFNDDVIYKTPVDFNLSDYMNSVAEELKTGLAIFGKNEKKVVVFGSARESYGSNYYIMAEQLGAKLSAKGYSVVTGGGPGIMEATLKGAYENCGETYGINILLPHEQLDNKYIKHGYLCNHLFTRKVILTREMQCYFVMPGGFGTLDELFEVLTLMATNIQYRIPIVLIGKKFWSGLIEWIKMQLLEERHYITNNEFKLLKLVDTIDEAINFLD